MNGYGGGVQISSDAVISNNIISNNAVTSSYMGSFGGGISIFGGTSSISNNIISNNTASSSEAISRGGGLHVAGGIVTISKNVINSNSLYTSYWCWYDKTCYGGGIDIGGSAVTISNNTISNNTALNASAISYYDVPDNKDIRFNLITANNSIDLSQTYTIYTNSHPLFNFNNIFNNTAAYSLWNDTPQGSTNVNAENNWWGSATELSSWAYDWVDNATKGIVDYAPWTTAIRTDAPISPPTGLYATAGMGQTSLTWTANTEADTAGYKVYWSTTSGFPYANSVDVGNVTSYTISALPAGTYYVTVTAYDTTYNSANNDPTTIVNDNQTNGNESWYTMEQVVNVP